MTGFIQLSRDQKVDELIAANPLAFALVTTIARRARRSSVGLNRHGLEMGEALIGDYAAIGLTRREYRTALDNLSTWGIATFKATNKGTIAKLMDSSVYDINEDDSGQPEGQQAASKRPASGQQAANGAATNEECKEEKNGKNEKKSVFDRPTREELSRHVTDDLGFHPEDAEHLWNVWEENGWKRKEGGKMVPIQKWKLAVAKWKSGGYLPSQKPGFKPSVQEPTIAYWQAPHPAPSFREELLGNLIAGAEAGNPDQARMLNFIQSHQ